MQTDTKFSHVRIVFNVFSLVLSMCQKAVFTALHSDFHHVSEFSFCRQFFGIHASVNEWVDRSVTRNRHRNEC